MKIKDYSIIETEWIIKRIEELETKRNSEHNLKHDKSALRYENTILELKSILSKLKPLTPIVENAYDAGMLDKELSLSFDNPKGRYLSSIKLDI